MSALVATLADSAGQTVSVSQLITSVAPTAKILYGAAPSGFSQASVTLIESEVSPKVLRTYDNPVPANWASTNDAKYVASGVIIDESVKAPVGSLASGDPTQVADVKAILAGMPGGYFTDQHEPENPSKAIDPVQYRADWTAKGTGLLDLIDAENAKRTPDKYIVGVPTFMAYSLYSSDNRDIHGRWLPVDPRIKLVGFDCYATTDVQHAQAFAKQYGLSWCVPEYGWHAGAASTPAPLDSDYLARVKADQAIWTQSPQPIFVLMYNVGGDSVDNQPLTRAYWKALNN